MDDILKTRNRYATRFQGRAGIFYKNVGIVITVYHGILTAAAFTSLHVSPFCNLMHTRSDLSTPVGISGLLVCFCMLMLGTFRGLVCLLSPTWANFAFGTFVVSAAMSVAYVTGTGDYSDPESIGIMLTLTHLSFILIDKHQQCTSTRLIVAMTVSGALAILITAFNLRNERRRSAFELVLCAIVALFVTWWYSYVLEKITSGGLDDQFMPDPDLDFGFCCWVVVGLAWLVVPLSYVGRAFFNYNGPISEIPTVEEEDRNEMNRITERRRKYEEEAKRRQKEIEFRAVQQEEQKFEKNVQEMKKQVTQEMEAKAGEMKDLTYQIDMLRQAITKQQRGFMSWKRAAALRAKEIGDRHEYEMLKLQHDAEMQRLEDMERMRAFKRAAKGEGPVPPSTIGALGYDKVGAPVRGYRGGPEVAELLGGEGRTDSRVSPTMEMVPAGMIVPGLPPNMVFPGMHPPRPYGT